MAFECIYRVSYEISSENPVMETMTTINNLRPEGGRWGKNALF